MACPLQALLRCRNCRGFCVACDTRAPGGMRQTQGGAQPLVDRLLRMYVCVCVMKRAGGKGDVVRGGVRERGEGRGERGVVESESVRQEGGDALVVRRMSGTTWPDLHTCRCCVWMQRRSGNSATEARGWGGRGGREKTERLRGTEESRGHTVWATMTSIARGSRTTHIHTHARTHYSLRMEQRSLRMRRQRRLEEGGTRHMAGTQTGQSHPHPA